MYTNYLGLAFVCQSTIRENMLIKSKLNIFSIPCLFKIVLDVLKIKYCHDQKNEDVYKHDLFKFIVYSCKQPRSETGNSHFASALPVSEPNFKLI